MLKKKKMTAEENHWWQVILAAVKKLGYHKIQFMNSKKRLEGFSHMICRAMQLKEFEGKEGVSLLKKTCLWVAKNKYLIRSALNECRNYSASQVRAESVSRLCMKNAPMPTPEQILDCVTREPELMNTEEGRKLFDDYSNVWLGKVATHHHWDKEVRSTQTISQATKDDGSPCITPGMEALVYMNFTNQQHRLPNIVEAKKTGIPYKKSKDESPWTITDGGQMVWGGWSKGGQDEWKAVREKCRQARERPHVAQMEEESRIRLQARLMSAGPQAVPAGINFRQERGEDSDVDL